MMNIQWQDGVIDADALMRLESDCWVVGICDDQGERLSPLLQAADAAMGGTLTRLADAGELPRKAGETLVLHEPAGLTARRLMLVGLGPSEKCDAVVFLKAARAAARALASGKAISASWSLGDSTVQTLTCTRAQVLSLSIQALHEAVYRLDGYRQEAAPRSERTVTLAGLSAVTAADRRVVDAAIATAHGVALARRLGDTPPNVCTPAYLADTARTLGETWPLKVEVLERQDLETLGANAFLAVSQGSSQPPRLIVLRHDGGGEDQAPVVLVGKGVTFDSGGISIKPSAAMDEMKYDMCGAATVLGVLNACAELALPLNVVGVIAACENMPSGGALKPGDIIRSLSGQHIEVLDTDAEGRLILCDALTYAQRFQPETIIDIATLTGACVIALGSVHSGLYANRDDLGEALLAAGRESGDTAWRMPLDDAYQEQLKSPFADMANIGGRPGGSITAACFLSRFVDGPWAHLDIAGTAWKSGLDKGGTGRPVSLLVQYLLNRTAN